MLIIHYPSPLFLNTRDTMVESLPIDLAISQVEVDRLYLDQVAKCFLTTLGYIAVSNLDAVTFRDNTSSSLQVQRLELVLLDAAGGTLEEDLVEFLDQSLLLLTSGYGYAHVRTKQIC